ncbi:MAG: 6-phosphogluconolactonase, partial [Segetibacter sp.]|nr:6-phosphogluconolactonase [Segetibacter sp.]
MPKLHIYKNEKETCYAFAEWLAELVKETLNRQDRFTIALSG